MKVRNVHVVLFAIVCFGFIMESSLSARTPSKPSLSAAMQAKTVGALLDVIQSASIQDNPKNRLGDFFVIINDDLKKAGSPKAAKIKLDYMMVLNFGDLKKDPDQIQKIKKFHGKILNKLFKKKTVEAWIDDYADYLLYFSVGPNKIYINNPWPPVSDRAIYNIIQKWAK